MADQMSQMRGHPRTVRPAPLRGWLRAGRMLKTKGLGIGVTLGLTMGLIGVASPAAATYPGTNGRIAFASVRSGGDWNVFTMKPDGSDVRQLTFLTAGQAAALDQSWSPDRSKLVFEERNGDGSVRQIFEMNADGSNQHVLISDPSFFDFYPTFSPDGRKVLFTRCRMDFAACAIYTVNAKGRDLTAITHFDVKHDVFDQRAEFSPDGRRIAFESFNRGGVIGAIYLMSAQGADVRRVTPTGLEAAMPDWSPDSKAIAFVANCCDNLPTAIWTVHPDGSGLTQITSPGPEYDFYPKFSPDGERIVIERDSADFSTASILTMNLDGSDVTTIQANAGDPSWGPGG
jgi:Tol biopolymer transport system component